MEFGSVIFFKRVITGFVILLIVGLAIFSLIMCADNVSKKKEIESMQASIDALVSELEKADNAPVSVPEPPPEDGGNDGDNGGGDNDATDDVFTDVTIAVPEPALPSYASLYPDLYAESYTDEPDETYPDDNSVIYLTFDDGPSKHTYNILYYLKLYEVPATFFVIPDEFSEPMLKQILADGHSLGIHTASHNLNKIYTSVEDFLEDFKQAYDLIYEQTGYKTEIFRFPGGSVNDYNASVREEVIAEMTRRGFVYFDWNVDSKDAEGTPTWNSIYNKVLNEVADAMAKTGVETNRAVVLMHDFPGGEMTVYVLEDIIKALKNDPGGYTFGKLGKNIRPMQF